MKEDRIIEVYRGDLWECQLLESILKDRGIKCFLTNSVRSTYGPMATFAQQIQIMVCESEAAKALAVVNEFNANIR